MDYKKFVASIYLKDGFAVQGFTDHTIIQSNPVALAQSYLQNQIDEIIVFDFSTTDDEHEAAIAHIRKLTNEVEIPIIGAGNVKRMEDVKKLLYAGCKKAVLNFSKESNIALIEEVSKKFGRDKIVVSFDTPEILTVHKELIETYACECIYMPNHHIHEVLEAASIPLFINIPEVTLDKWMELLQQEMVCGTYGEIVNRNAKEISALKALCAEHDIPVNSYIHAMNWEEFKLNTDNMLPVVVQDYRTDEVLMVAYMNQEAYENTLKCGKMTYYSRSRKELWLKGETSGHFQYVKSLTADCDKDTLLARVSQIGPACHTGSHSCFFHEIIKKDDGTAENPLKVFEDVFHVIQDRKIHPKEGSYTNYLFEKGVDKILKKLGEEATEIVIAAKNPNPEEIKYEISDFLYHMMVLMAEKNVTWEEITQELAKR